MATQKRQIEEPFKAKLRGLKYEYREDIRDRAALEQNFRAKFEALNRVTLTPGEFSRLPEEITTPDVFTAARTLRERNSFIYHYHIWQVVENKGIDRRFLFITLENETEKMKAESANGLGIMHITKGTIEGWETAFPTMPEQQRIADCLTTLDDLIAGQAQKLEALKTHKKGLMQQLFPSPETVEA